MWRIATAVLTVCLSSVHMSADDIVTDNDYVVYRPTMLCDTIISSHANPADKIKKMIVEARCRVPGDTPRKKGESQSAWGLGLYGNKHTDSCEVIIRRITDYIDDVNGGRRLHVTATRMSQDGRELLACVDVDSDVDLNSGYNTMTMDAVNNDNYITVTISLGTKSLREIMTFSMPEWTMENECVMLTTGEVESRLFVVERQYDREQQLQSAYDPEILASGNGFSGSTIDGLWEYLDRENDNDYAKPGGFYRLATVTDANSQQTTIVYLDGAEVDDDKWKAGMIKGTLRKTIFAGNYDMTWNDAHMHPVESEMYCTISEDNSIMTFNFPELKTKLRFRRVQISK